MAINSEVGLQEAITLASENHVTVRTGFLLLHPANPKEPRELWVKGNGITAVQPLPVSGCAIIVDAVHTIVKEDPDTVLAAIEASYKQAARR